jgi:hypothetical protein
MGHQQAYPPGPFNKSEEIEIQHAGDIYPAAVLQQYRLKIQQPTSRLAMTELQINEPPSYPLKVWISSLICPMFSDQTSPAKLKPWHADTYANLKSAVTRHRAIRSAL